MGDILLCKPGFRSAQILAQQARSKARTPTSVPLMGDADFHFSMIRVTNHVTIHDLLLTAHYSFSIEIPL